MRSGVQQIPPMNAVYFGAKAAENWLLKWKSEDLSASFCWSAEH
jgi:hypothetical protein